MKNINSQKLVEIVNSKSQVLDVEINNISTDSRNIKEGDLFIAIKGENFDAHSFVKDVIDRGAALAIVNYQLDNVAPERQIVVDDTTHAFGLIGSYIRSLYKGTIIGLTGSAGKTTTREEIKFALSQFAPTYSTCGNFNNFIGVPMSLINLDMDSKYAVIEMGMSAKGEISKLVSYVRPDIAIITNVYPMHIEFFENLEGIAHAKAEIFEGLKKGGVAILNADSNFLNIQEEAAQIRDAKIVSYGKKNVLISKQKGSGMELVVNLGEDDIAFELSGLGEHNISNALCALEVVRTLGLDVYKAAESLKDFGALDGRGKIHQLKIKDGTYLLIDDSYSGQPESMKLAIDSLNKLEKKGRKIAVIGKMAELGNTSKERHIEIGKALADTDVDIVIGVCPETKDILAQLPNYIKTYYFQDKESLDDFLLNNLLQNKDIVLIKGARYSSKLYQVAEFLIKNGVQ